LGGELVIGNIRGPHFDNLRYKGLNLFLCVPLRYRMRIEEKNGHVIPKTNF